MALVDDLEARENLLVAVRGGGRMTVTCWWSAVQQLVAAGHSPRNRVVGQGKGNSVVVAKVMMVMLSAVGWWQNQ